MSYAFGYRTDFAGMQRVLSDFESYIGERNLVRQNSRRANPVAYFSPNLAFMKPCLLPRAA
jgi:hypothetical protein